MSFGEDTSKAPGTPRVLTAEESRMARWRQRRAVELFQTGLPWHQCCRRATEEWEEMQGETES